MKRVVVTNQAGDIIATAPHFDETYSPDDGGPNVQEVVPTATQFVHVVEFPDSIQSGEELRGFTKRTGCGR